MRIIGVYNKIESNSLWNKRFTTLFWRNFNKTIAVFEGVFNKLFREVSFTLQLMKMQIYFFFSLFQRRNYTIHLISVIRRFWEERPGFSYKWNVMFFYLFYFTFIGRTQCKLGVGERVPEIAASSARETRYYSNRNVRFTEVYLLDGEGAFLLFKWRVLFYLTVRIIFSDCGVKLSSKSWRWPVRIQRHKSSLKASNQKRCKF